MYTNKFKRSTDTAVITIVSGLVAGIHFAGYEALTASEDIAYKAATTTVVQAVVAKAAPAIRTDVFVVTAKRL